MEIFDTVDETSDSTYFIQKTDVPKVLNTPYWSVVKSLTTFLSATDNVNKNKNNNSNNINTNNKDDNNNGNDNNKSVDWYPYDVSCNLLQHLHNSRIHIDCNYEEVREIFILYFNNSH